MIRAEELCPSWNNWRHCFVRRQRGRLKSYFVATNDAIKQWRLRVEKRHATKTKKYEDNSITLRRCTTHGGLFIGVRTTRPAAAPAGCQSGGTADSSRPIGFQIGR